MSLTLSCLSFVILITKLDAQLIDKSLGRNRLQKPLVSDHQKIICTNHDDFKGDEMFTLNANAPNLGQLGFDNWIRMCCVQGVWIFYEDFNYNSFNLQVKKFKA